MQENSKFYVDLMQQPAEVTGSFILAVVKVDGKVIKFVVDCGIYQEEGEEDRNLVFPTNPNSVEFMILTHTHIDHCGRIPYFVKKGFHGKIYTTKVNKRTLAKPLYDVAKVIQDTSKRKNELPIFNAEDVPSAVELTEGYDYNVSFEVNENITITFGPNGHLPGAAVTYVNIHNSQKDNIYLTFMGDYNDTNMFYKVAPPRNWITRLPVTIITESTYGDMDSDKICKVFNKNIVNALKSGKNTIVIPVFSQGRAQEILYCLKDLQSKYPELLANVPIFYDGKLSVFYTEMYKVLIRDGVLKFYENKKDFIPNNLECVGSKEMRKNVVSNPDRKIIVTTSGMGTYGPAQTYIPAFVKEPDALIHFTGYCSPNSLGYNLKFAEKGDIVKVGGVKVIKRADVEFTNEFSAHAKADKLIKFLKRFDDLRFVIVNHGKNSAKDALADRILIELGLDHVGILGREYFYRIDPDGFVEGFTSKFL